jgi:hypothetical protein
MKFTTEMKKLLNILLAAILFAALGFVLFNAKGSGNYERIGTHIIEIK